MQKLSQELEVQIPQELQALICYVEEEKKNAEVRKFPIDFLNIFLQILTFDLGL